MAGTTSNPSLASNRHKKRVHYYCFMCGMLVATMQR